MFTGCMMRRTAPGPRLGVADTFTDTAGRVVGLSGHLIDLTEVLRPETQRLVAHHLQQAQLGLVAIERGWAPCRGGSPRAVD